MAYNEDKIIHMNLEKLLEEYAPAYCDTWEEWFKEANPNNGTKTGELVGRLSEELIKYGKFTEPIHLGHHDGEEDDDDAKPIANGMHRIAAHYYSKVNEVKVINYEDIIKDSHNFMVYLEVECFLKDKNNSYYNGENFFTDIKDLLSLRLDEDEWMELESLSQNNNIVYLQLVTSNEKYTVDLLEKVYNKVEEVIEENIYEDFLKVDEASIKMFKVGEYK